MWVMILFVLRLYNRILKITCFPLMMKIENKIIIIKIKKPSKTSTCPLMEKPILSDEIIPRQLLLK